MLFRVNLHPEHAQEKNKCDSSLVKVVFCFFCSWGDACTFGEWFHLCILLLDMCQQMNVRIS